LKAQLGVPGTAAEPVAVIATAVPFITPDAVPAIVTPPPQAAVKVPEIVVAVWLTIWNWKLPQVFAEGTPAGKAADVHRPTRDEFEGALLLFAVPAGADAAGAAALGAAMLVVECSKPHATVRTEAAARATQFDSIFFITNL
jgi:hypothetical protein